MDAMRRSQPLGDQEVDVFADERVGRVFEHALNLQVGKENAPLPIDHDDRVG
jgi:hypothetical protein